MIKIVIVTCALLCGAGLKAATLNKPAPKVCVIGAGVAGMSAARHLKDAGIDFVVLETTKYVGGTWRYDERVGKDEYGLPILTSMYKHLRSNLPKIAMELWHFPISEEAPSFLTWDIYYNYLISFSKHFELDKHIKFLHRVTLVTKVGDTWKVIYEHVPTGERFEDNFDYVIVATGHLSLPHMPNIPGEKLFQGSIIHSHDYREPSRYSCRRVLIIGVGPSGMDIGLDVAEVSKSLIHSYHSRFKLRTPFPPNYVRKPDVKELNETGAIFEDGTFEELDDIIYATGYEYNYPFLDQTSGLTVTPRLVMPLHKQMLNINQPTMFIMGVVTRACVVVALDAQARYAVSLIRGDFRPPSRADMMDELQKQIEDLRQERRPIHHMHVLATKEDRYYAGLSKESGIERVKPVFYKIHVADMQAIFDNLYTFRNYNYTVIDDETFVRVLIEMEQPSRNLTCPAAY